MRIFFYTKYSRNGASSRYRSYQFQDHYRSAGVKTRCFPLFPEQYLDDLYSGQPGNTHISDLYWRRWKDLEWASDCDLVVIEKELFPYLPAFAEKGVFAKAKAVALDYDDAIFFKYQHHPRLLTQKFLGEKLDRLMSWSDGVIGGNGFLTSYAAQHAPKSWTVPTSVDVDKYDPHDHDHEGLITIGWIGTPITSKYLGMLKKPIEALAREVPVRFIVIGAEAPTWQGVQTQSYSWLESKEAEWIRWMDIGLMPLEDTPWEKGKCGLKILQYMAARVVPVASDVGANRDIVEDGVDGFLCGTESDWLDRLMELSRDSALRMRMGDAARGKVVSGYSLPVAARRLLNIYREVSGQPVAHEAGLEPSAVRQPEG